MPGANRCPYCLQRISDPADAAVVGANEPLAGFIGVDEDAAVHGECYENAADRV